MIFIKDVCQTTTLFALIEEQFLRKHALLFEEIDSAYNSSGCQYKKQEEGDALCWEEPKVKDDEILIRVEATALNRADTLQRQGKYPPPKGDSEYPGLDCSGIIELVGKNVSQAVFTFEIDDSGGDVIWRSAGRNLQGWGRHRVVFKTRYSMAVNVVGFAYAMLQGFDFAYQLATGNHHKRRHYLRYYFDLAMDQAIFDRIMLTYLLISSGSSAATRVDDWKSNWGADKFPQLATTSVGLVPIAVIARTRNIDEENRTTKDFLILRPMKSHLKKQNSSLVHTDVQNWDAELYVKLDNNIKLDLGQDSLYIGCMKSGEGLIHEVFKMVLRGLSSTKLTRPGKFRRCLDGYAVKSSIKAKDGVPYPLEKTIFFIPQPPTLILYDKIM
ncbi:hypothetical protein L2E82_21933 [Cichorium intybus]|uniref:Uncharacterized protein n=1 Tax=Cichorium intybus TaxID=13427 RepID=A0ACB9DXK3_CICIN|nr:hypothetical protein L2E82_21933 [Cichorium intybus]